MSRCDYPNHCPDLKKAGENLLRQELKIKELEQQNKELISKLEQYYNHFCDFKICGSTCKNLKCTDKAELKTFINKYK